MGRLCRLAAAAHAAGCLQGATGSYGLADDVKPQALCHYSSTEPCCMAHSAVGEMGHVTFCWVGALAQVLPHATLNKNNQYIN